MKVASTSIAAYHTTPITPIRERVLEIIESYGKDGCITDDVIATFAKTDKTNTGRITGRFSELVAEGKIYRAGDTRPGVSGKQQMVMRASKWASVVPVVKPPRPKKTKRSGFVNGLMYAARILLNEPDLLSAQKALRRELIKAAKL